MLTKERLKKFQTMAASRQEGVVVLEDIYDPHNAAAVLRSCEGFGIQKVYYIFNKERKYNPQKVGFVSSASANKWLEFKTFTSAKECYNVLKKQGYIIYATILGAKAKSIFKADFTEPKIALVFGNEHRGLSKQAVKLAHLQVYVPMQGFVQSFNLSVTAAICLYEMFRQRQAAPAKYLLPKKAQEKIVKAWIKK